MISIKTFNIGKIVTSTRAKSSRKHQKKILQVCAHRVEKMEIKVFHNFQI